MRVFGVAGVVVTVLLLCWCLSPMSGFSASPQYRNLRASDNENVAKLLDLRGAWPAWFFLFFPPPS